MTLQQKAKSEGINPVGILMVIVILGCILACPYNTAKDHLNYFDYFMLGNAPILVCKILILAFHIEYGPYYMDYNRRLGTRFRSTFKVITGGLFGILIALVFLSLSSDE